MRTVYISREKLEEMIQEAYLGVVEKQIREGLLREAEEVRHIDAYLVTVWNGKPNGYYGKHAHTFKVWGFDKESALRNFVSHLAGGALEHFDILADDLYEEVKQACEDEGMTRDETEAYLDDKFVSIDGHYLCRPYLSVKEYNTPEEKERFKKLSDEADERLRRRKEKGSHP